jgi:hypothetical protein
LAREFFLNEKEVVTDKIKDLFGCKQRDGWSPA